MTVKACRCLNCGRYRSFHEGHNNDRCPNGEGRWEPPKEYEEPRPTQVFDEWEDIFRNSR